MIDFGDPEKLARILDGMVPRNERETAALEAGAEAIRCMLLLGYYSKSLSEHVRAWAESDLGVKEVRVTLTPERGQEIIRWLSSEEST